MHRIIALTAVCLMLLGSLAGCAARDEAYERTFYGYFDTVITLKGYASSRAQFDQAAEIAEAELKRLHALFDRFHPHEGIAGVWAVNHAADEAVFVDGELMALLKDCLDGYEKTGGAVDVFMGALTDLWKRYRDAGRGLPSEAEVLKARGHIGPEGFAFDFEAGTARRLDPEAVIDLSAVAKGYAVERVAQLIEPVMESFLLDAGGNIRVGAAPKDGRDHWTVGVTDPEAALAGRQEILMKLNLRDLSAVTSGGYQRYYEHEGTRYHHLIDPKTGHPADRVLQSTVIASDSGLADFLSTAAFVMPFDAALSLIEGMDGVECIWVMKDGHIEMTRGARALVLE